MKTATVVACVLCLFAGVITAAPELDEKSKVDRAEEVATETLDRFLNSGHPPLTSYRARRVLTASSMGGRMNASLEAWTALEPNGTFAFEIVRQEGSGLIRKRVLVAALETEQRTRNGGEMAQSDLTIANYEFQVDNDSRDDGLARIRLVPRRKTPMLLTGIATVRRQDGDILRIDGSPSKSPSWWTRHVNVVRRYQRITGVRVPIEMGSEADVRFAGKSTFSMTYEYESVNGVAVDDSQDDGSPVVGVSER
jgi:hypothetical protein